MRCLRNRFTEADREQAQRDILDLRHYLLPILMRRQGSVCNICKLPSLKYDIDHIVYNPMVSINELQALCIACHVKKTDFRPLRNR